MSSLTLEPSYMPVGTEATRPREMIGVPEYIPEKLALVIPTLREVECLRGLLDQVRAVLGSLNISYEILVVDDDSGDGTCEMVSAIALEDHHVRLLVRKNERGLSGAILHGWQSTDAAILGAMDADFQHPPELLSRLLTAVLNGHDLAIGSRYAKGGRPGGWNPVRKLISSVAVWVTWPVQRPWLRAKDPMSGYFLVRRHCVQNVMFRPTGFKLLLEILTRGHVRSLQEIPFAFGRRSAGTSKADLSVAWDYLLLLMKLYGCRFGLLAEPQRASGD